MTIEFGPGAYRETLLDAIPPVEPVDPKPVGKRIRFKSKNYTFEFLRESFEIKE